MTTPAFTHIDDIFTNKQFLKDQSTSLYNLVTQEAPEISDGWLLLLLFNKDPLNNSNLQKPNMFSTSYENKTFYKNISIGTLYKTTFSYQENGLDVNKNTYWLFLNNQMDGWTLFSDNYIISEQNKFLCVWYNITNFKYNLSVDLQYLGDNFYSQPLVRKNSDQEYFNNIPIHTEQNKSIFISDSTDITWSSNITEKYLRIYIQGYKEPLNL